MTIDVQNKFNLFWNNNDLNDAGRMIEKCWIDLIDRFQIELDEYVIMPAQDDEARTLNQKNNLLNQNCGKEIIMKE